MTASIDIERKRGDTKRMVFIIKDDTGAVVDISTGYSFIMTVDPSKSPTDNTGNVFQITGSIIDGPNGRVSFSPSIGDADNLGNYYYDIQMVDPNTEKSTIVEGKFKLTQDITKD